MASVKREEVNQWVRHAIALGGFGAYPGPPFSAALRDGSKRDDAAGVATLAQPIYAVLLTQLFQQHTADLLQMNA